MVIQYSNDKNVQIWRNFVENYDDRSALKQFRRHFGMQLERHALKLHRSLCTIPNAHLFNLQQGCDNKLEILQGRKSNTPLVLKVRINQAWRKCCNALPSPDATPITNANWDGNYQQVQSLYVIDINNHNYNAL